VSKTGGAALLHADPVGNGRDGTKRARDLNLRFRLIADRLKREREWRARGHRSCIELQLSFLTGSIRNFVCEPVH
jgi:hypothetical protein